MNVTELAPNTLVAVLAMVGLIVVAVIAAVPPTVAIVVSDRRAAKRYAAAAKRVAEVAVKAEEAAANTEQVRVHLKESDSATNGQLANIQHTSDQIHVLVNNNLSEQFKQKLLLANMLLAEDPTNLEYQRLAKQAEADVEAHRPAESTVREGGGLKVKGDK